MTYRIHSAVIYFDSVLVILAQPITTTGGEARGLDRLIVPAGPLAQSLTHSMRAGELWRLDLADDGQTVVAARYEGGETV